MKIAVLGGGASGIMAAIFAAQNGAEVTLIEKKEQLGKKLSVTGNGKCNYGNLYMAPKYYRGHDVGFVNEILKREPIEKSIDWFESVGMLSMSRKNYMYPATQSAVTVIQTLKKRLRETGVRVMTDTRVNRVTKTDDFIIETDKGTIHAERVILSFGSEAGVKDPDSFNGYDILTSFGHYVYPAIPTLVSLNGKGDIEPLWEGVRVIAAISYKDLREEGEIQFTKTGISGIPVFQVSHELSEETEKRPVFVTLDFLPNYDKESLIGFVKDLIDSPRKDETAKDILELWLPKKLGMALKKTDEALFAKRIGNYTEGDSEKLVSLVKEFSYRVTGHGDLLSAQAVNGGADTTEFKNTCESKLVPGLFVTGELLDIDGLCGGYNLHFAFATGRIAGEEAAK